MSIYHNPYLHQLQIISTPGKYTTWYCEIITRAIQRASTRKIANQKCGYVELHHILPRSFKLGGVADKLNYAYLTAREHFICHMLLARMSTGVNRQAMLIGCLLMSHRHIDNNEYRITSRTFAALKEVGPWNKGHTGGRGKVTSEYTKDLFRKLYTGKARPDEAKQNMKAGWARKKAEGYAPWNKGVKGGTSASAIGCVFVSPTGEEFIHQSYRQGCIAHKLHTNKISHLRTGLIQDYKGWTVRDMR
jgi:hypothetical protein